MERTCDPVTAGEYQSILFEIVGCAEFAGLALDEEGERSSNTPRRSTKRQDRRSAPRPLDDRTLQIDLTNPAPYYHTIAYTWVFYPVKKEIVDADPDNWWKTAENHIGNGPFTVTGIDEDQRWTFEANENYWQGRPEARRYRVRLHRGRRGRPRGLSRRRSRHRSQLEAATDSRGAGGSGAVRAVRHLPARRDLQPGHEPYPGAVHRPEGPRGVRLRHRPRNPLCGGAVRQLHPDALLDPARRRWRDRNRQVRLRPGGGCPGPRRILVRRARGPARDHAVYNSDISGRVEAGRVDRRRDSRHSRRRAQPSSRSTARP